MSEQYKKLENEYMELIAIEDALEVVVSERAELLDSLENKTSFNYKANKVAFDNDMKEWQQAKLNTYFKLKELEQMELLGL